MAYADGRQLTGDELLTANNWLHNEAKGDKTLMAQKATEYGLNAAQRAQLGITGLAGQAWNNGADAQPNEITNAKAWATGKTGQQVYDKAKELGVTADQFGQVFGISAEDIKAHGYDSPEGMNQQYAGYTFDGTKWNEPKKVPGAATYSGMVAQAGVTPWNVTPEQTVQHQANQIIRADSPLMQQARGQAMQQMNERGLVNSSLAIQAGQDAVMGRALEIAKPDAETFGNAAQFNAGAENTASMFNAGQLNTTNLADKELAQKESQFSRTLTQQQDQFAQNAALDLRKLGIQVDLARMDDQTRRYLAELGASTAGVAAGISASAQMAIADANRTFNLAENKTTAFNRQWENYTDRVLKITVDPNLGEKTKDKLIASETNAFKGWAAVNNIVGDLTFVDSYGGTNKPAPAPSPAQSSAGSTVWAQPDAL